MSSCIDSGIATQPVIVRPFFIGSNGAAPSRANATAKRAGSGSFTSTRPSHAMQKIEPFAKKASLPNMRRSVTSGSSAVRSASSALRCALSELTAARATR